MVSSEIKSEKTPEQVCGILENCDLNFGLNAQQCPVLTGSKDSFISQKNWSRFVTLLHII